MKDYIYLQDTTEKRPDEINEIVEKNYKIGPRVVRLM